MQRRKMSKIAFVSACCLIFINGCSSSSKREAIEKVLWQDHQLSETMQASIAAGIKADVAIGLYSDQMKDIDVKKCPPEFREAFIRHANAWYFMSSQMAKEPQSFVDAFLDGFFNALSGELDGGEGRRQRLRNARMEEIKTTWAEVEAIAAKYGAKKPSRKSKIIRCGQALTLPPDSWKGVNRETE